MGKGHELLFAKIERWRVFERIEVVVSHSELVIAVGDEGRFRPIENHTAVVWLDKISEDCLDTFS